jgi:phosphotransferase system  glucose/maltose/N-acetylglucosamine-specific IIC component
VLKQGGTHVKVIDALKTILICLVFYAISSVLVAAVWPPLVQLLKHVPHTIPTLVAQGAAVLGFLVITHNQRGELPANSLPFRWLY